MKEFPLVFSFLDLIAGNGFVACVATQGRVLLVDEGNDDFWVHGVQPGGLSGGAHGRSAALTEFKTNYLGALYDIAVEARSFEAFQKDATEFLIQVNESNAGDWFKALAEVRRMDVSLEGLRRETAADTKPPCVRVELVQNSTTTPDSNKLPHYATAA